MGFPSFRNTPSTLTYRAVHHALQIQAEGSGLCCCGVIPGWAQLIETLLCTRGKSGKFSGDELVYVEFSKSITIDISKHRKTECHMNITTCETGIENTRIVITLRDEVIFCWAINFNQET